MSNKKYYWLKLKKDFFKRHDIKIIESMENGKDYVLFYLKLLLESIDHEGNLRFSDTIPYNDKMLSVITDTNIDIVRTAVKVFSELKMMEQMDDGTFYLSQIDSMLGAETEWAKKKREYRQSGQKKTMSDKSKILELEIEIEKDNNISHEIPDTIFSDANAPEPVVAKKKTEKKMFFHNLTEWKEVISDYELAIYERWSNAKIDNWTAQEFANLKKIVSLLEKIVTPEQLEENHCNMLSQLLFDIFEYFTVIFALDYDNPASPKLVPTPSIILKYWNQARIFDRDYLTEAKKKKGGKKF